MHDVCVIGAGIAGSSFARELSAYELDVLVLEAGYDVACGSTRANSGIVHGGYDPVPGTLKATFNVAGSKMYEQLSRELGFAFERCGSLVVAFDQSEVPALHELLQRGHDNGVEGLRIMDSDELHQAEPNLSPAAIAALWVPTGGIVDPYGACLAFAENAVENGATFQFSTRVKSIARHEDGYEIECVDVETGAITTVEAKVVVNAAGVSSGEVCAMVSSHGYQITPRAGEYFLLDKRWGDAFHSTIFQVPTANGKGILVSPTTGGNMLLGPTAVARGGSDETYTTSDGLSYVLECASKTWERIPTGDIITNFAGLRATCVQGGDFVLGEPDDAPGFFNVGGFDSPGLTAAPAVARHYAEVIAQRLGASRNQTFNPHRQAPLRFSQMDNQQRAQLIAQDGRWGAIVCRCEMVSEAEIVNAIHSTIPACTTDAVKWRTRAGMGRCQAGFCLPLVAQIIARETGCDVVDVRKGRVGSRLALGHRGCLDGLPTVDMGDGGAQA